MTVPALWLKHRGLALAIADGYTLPGSDRDDVRQEALIALWVAATDWRPDGGASFPTFARMVVRRRLDTCLKLATRRKHEPLNRAVTVALDPDGEPAAIVDLLPHLHQVTDRVEGREQLAAVIRCIRDDLSAVERRAVVGIASGLSYVEIGPWKAVDNALARARRKLRAAA